jgi:glycolate oxidase FAD binding subunit
MTQTQQVSARDLDAIVGSDHLREAGSTDAIDGIQPRWVAEPGSIDEAAALLRLANDAGLAVAPRGSGTKMGLGNPPRAVDLILSTARMNRVLEHAAGDLVVRVEAGARLRDVQAELAKANQWLALDPPEPDATVGGIIATNAFGPRRLRYGGVRDLLIGVTYVLPDGTVARSGGKVVKNVAGYDLMKLHIGALGTLGAVAEVNLKVQARPEAEATILGHFEAPVPAIEAGLRLARQYLAPASAIVLDRNALWACGFTADWRWTLALKLEGYRREVDAARDVAAKAIREAGGRTEGQDIPVGFWEAARDWSDSGDDSVLLRAIVPLKDVAAIMAALPADGQVMAQPAAGVVELRLPAGSGAAAVRRLRSAAGEDGQVIVAAAPASVKSSVDVWGPPPPGFPIMRALKQALDPNGILNPGRFVGAI